MPTLPGVFLGFEEDLMDHCPALLSRRSGVLHNTQAANQHTDASGGLSGKRSMVLSNVQWALFGIRRTDIPWEEVVADMWFRNTAGWCRIMETRFNNSIGPELRRETDGTLTHRVAGTEQDTTGVVFTYGTAYSMSTHIKYDATTGFITTWQDGVQVLDTQTIDTTVGGSAFNMWYVYHNGAGYTYYDDYAVRPRTMLITGVTSLDTATPTDVTGVTSTETATVYAWENDSEDSAGGNGDPTLAPGQWRIYLKDVSFGPDATSGFQNGETLTVTGLTGTILCDAPTDGFAAGLEPGSQFFFDKLHVLKLTLASTGTEDSDGTLTGGATDRADALSSYGDGKEVRHTATAESVTLTTGGLPTAQGIFVDEVVGLSVATRGLRDGGDVTSFKPRILDNGGSGQNGPEKFQGHYNAMTEEVFPLNGSGEQWKVGVGAGTIDNAEPGYETA
jgi:hypothetical protein